jgi:SAM-dependent methyltransferase
MGGGSPHRACPVCGSSGRADLLHSQRFVLPVDHVLPDHYDVVACGACGFVYADTPASQDDYDAYYVRMSKYEADYGGADGTLYADRATWISALLGDHDAAIIDVGCGNGELLSELKVLGFRDLTALDPSPECIGAIRARGIDGVVGSVFDAPTERKYEAVTMSGVLEHLRDVTAAMNAVESLLVPAGVMFVFVPDASRYAEYDTVPFDYFNIEHINHFDEVSLINAGLLHGFRVVQLLKTEVTLAKTRQPMIHCAFRYEPGEASAWLRSSSEAVRRYVAQTGTRGRTDAIIGEVRASGEPVVVWGAGNYGSRLLASSDLSRCHILCFVDNDRHKQGTTLSGVPVVAPRELKGAQLAATVLVAAAVFHEEIVAEARALGLTGKIIVLDGC